MIAHKLTKYIVRGSEDKLSFASQILFLAEIHSERFEHIFDFLIVKDSHNIEILVDFDDIYREGFDEDLKIVFDEILSVREIDALLIGDMEDYSESVVKWISERKDEHFIQAYTAYMIDDID
ncbi:hypothetical protein [Exiguobacterium sp. BG5(2022)]|uniref:hypothetical protein n=1 Tax=Exiguobacterium sp. BG5(2022) TaxID=2962595 RepID=UPI0028826D09|nr:hypothetical protein [Exiguobacterium sp. BG5(2022)]MDT0193698.1 hypothetical protein [Exiguobacterium sp. BG5(2022)]